jgi:hypothetical protein
MMKTRIENKKLFIEIDLEDEPRLSVSKKTIVIASTHGSHATEATYEGHTITVGLNAYFKA